MFFVGCAATRLNSCYLSFCVIDTAQREMAKGADDKLTAEQQREANTVVEGLLAKDDDGTVKLPSEQDKDLSRCWRTWVTVLEMLADRGYIISEEERGVTRQAFQNKYGDDNGVAEYACLSIFIHDSANVRQSAKDENRCATITGNDDLTHTATI